LAGHRAATSVYATLGVAAATLLVVGGILAGPSILECSRDGGSFGACLRDKAGDSGLITPDPAVEPPAPTGWMEAAANEFDAPPSAPVELAGSPAAMLANELAAASDEPIEMAIAPAADLAAVTAPPSAETAVVALAGPEGEVSADVKPAAPPPTGTAALNQPETGSLSARAPVPEVAEVVIAPQPIDHADDLTSAVEPPPPEPAPVELEPVDPAPPPDEPEPSEPVDGTPEQAFSEPVIVVEFNPQYPNVIVLPPPAAGDNSSIRSLQLN
jgi:hypothetical protein